MSRDRLPYLVAFAAAAAGAGLGRAVTTTYLPVLLDRIDEAPALIGAVMLVNAAAGLAVPLVVGFWSDRLRARGGGRTRPFVWGGSLLTAGGLAATAVGWSSSYLVLALTGAVVYVGLNAITTAHRALVPELFTPETRARATSAQELALLGGGLLALAVGGALTGLSLWAPFLLAAVLVPLLALPTLRRVSETRAFAPGGTESRPLGYYLSVARRPGVRAFLLAQGLWVLGYAALPSFFLLYAERELDLTTATASILLAGFGVTTGAATLAAGRVRTPQRLGSMLVLGVLGLGGGLLTVSLSTSLVTVSPALLAAAVGFGVVNTVAFPLFSTLIPDGEAGGYTALFFSVRAIASALALPAAGSAIELTGSYRTLFAVGAIANLGALLPLARLVPVPAARPVSRWFVGVTALYGLVLTSGLLVAGTELRRVDEALFRALNRLGPGPRAVFEVLEEPLRNYALLGALILGAALVSRRHRLRDVVALELLSVLLALGLLEGMYAVYDRPRPSEVFDRAEVVLAYGHNWARIEAFPSGHMAVLTAFAASAWSLLPRLRRPFLAYLALNAVTRVLFGAHFPFDVAGGIALGYGSAIAARSLLVRLAAREHILEASPGAAAELDPRRVWAVMPSHGDEPDRSLVDGILGSVAGLTIVDDGSAEHVARELTRTASESGALLLRFPERRGKGAALRAGIDSARAQTPPPEAVLLIDADGQHPPATIPAFLAAASTAEFVIGDRFADLAAMPRHRRLANLASRRLLELTTGRRLRDTQSGMRLLRGRALELPLTAGGYEAETRHLKAALVHGLAVAWVPIPAIYAEGTRSSFRPLRDSARVLAALVQSAESPAPSQTPAPRRGRFRPRRPTRSALPDTPAREPLRQQEEGAAL